MRGAHWFLLGASQERELAAAASEHKVSDGATHWFLRGASSAALIPCAPGRAHG